MTSDPTDPLDPDRAQALFVAERLLERSPARGAALGTGDLVAYLTGDPRISSATLNRALLQRPALRQEFNALRARFARIDIPAQAAASTGDVQTRRLSGGTLSLFSVPPSPLVYLNVQFDDPALSGRRLALVLTTADARMLRLVLPEANDEGALMVVLDPANPEDAALSVAIGAPTTSGSFIDIGGIDPDATVP